MFEVPNEVASVTLVRGAVTSSESEEIPSEFIVRSVYPNPAMEAVTVYAGLPAPGRLRVEVYDVLGRRVEVVGFGLAEAGWTRLQLETGGLATGMYFMRVGAGGDHVTHAFVVHR